MIHWINAGVVVARSFAYQCGRQNISSPEESGSSSLDPRTASCYMARGCSLQMQMDVRSQERQKDGSLWSLL